MNQLKVFEKRSVLGQELKIYGTQEEPLFLAKDVADWIEHSKANMMLQSIDEDEKLMETIFTSGQNRQMWFLTEDGMYEVLMQSRKPIAKAFKKQVKNILKEIRKTGRYEKPKSSMEMLELQFEALKETSNRVDTVEKDVIYLKEEVKLDPGEYNYLTSHISRNVRRAIQSFGLANTKEVKKELFRDINRGLNEFCEVATRTQLKQKHFDKAMEYIQIWVPSTSTKLKVQQLSMDLDKEG